MQAQSDASAPRLPAPTAPLSTWAIYSGLRSMLSSPSKVSGISSSAYSPHPCTLNSGPVRSSKDQVAMRGEVEELALVVGLHRVEEADDIGLSRDLFVDLPVEGGLLGLVTGLDAAARRDPVLGDAGPGTANDQHRAVGSDEGGADSFDHLGSSLCLLTDSVEQLAAVDGDGLPRDERGGGAHNDATRGRNVLGPATARDALALDPSLWPRTVPGGESVLCLNLDGSGYDRVDAGPVRAQFPGKKERIRLSEPAFAALYAPRSPSGWRAASPTPPAVTCSPPGRHRLVEGACCRRNGGGVAEGLDGAYGRDHRPNPAPTQMGSECARRVTPRRPGPHPGCSWASRSAAATLSGP